MRSQLCLQGAPQEKQPPKSTEDARPYVLNFVLSNKINVSHFVLIKIQNNKLIRTVFIEVKSGLPYGHEKVFCVKALFFSTI